MPLSTDSNEWIDVDWYDTDIGQWNGTTINADNVRDAMNQALELFKPGEKFRITRHSEIVYSV